MPSYWSMGDDPEIPEAEDFDDSDDDAQLLSLDLLSWRRNRRYILGLDLGQVHDPSALAVVQRAGSTEGVIPVPYLQRYPLKTSYPDIVTHVRRLLASRPLHGQTTLVIDATGVGAPVVDLFVKAKLQPIAVWISGGDQVHRTDRLRYSVPKRELVASVQVLLQSSRLKIASGLPDAEILVKELLNFQVKITASAHDTYGAWREGQHDDLVLALALATWYAEHGHTLPV